MKFDIIKNALIIKPTSEGEYILQLRLEDAEGAYKLETLKITIQFSNVLKEEIKIIKSEMEKDSSKQELSE